MFTQSPAEGQCNHSNGELLDWRTPKCQPLSEIQFTTAQQACSQAWKAIQCYMRKQAQGPFTAPYAARATDLLGTAILDACACQPRDPARRLSVDQLCDAGLSRVGFIIARDEFGVAITGDGTAFPEGEG